MQGVRVNRAWLPTIPVLLSLDNLLAGVEIESGTLAVASALMACAGLAVGGMIHLLPKNGHGLDGRHLGFKVHRGAEITTCWRLGNPAEKR
jgi:hypothetical protein